MTNVQNKSKGSLQILFCLLHPLIFSMNVDDTTMYYLRRSDSEGQRMAENI